MHARSILMLTAVVLLGSTASGQPAATVDQLSWLAGCWTMPRADGYTEEVWLPPAGGAMLGVSRTIRSGRMTEHEFIVVRAIDGALAYVARPSGQAEAAFHLKSMTAAEAVFENLAHDFPQRIIYRRTGTGVTARIEGPRGGEVKGIDFVYRTCR